MRDLPIQQGTPNQEAMNGPKQKRFTSPKNLSLEILERTNLIISGLKIKAIAEITRSIAIFAVYVRFS
jgi:hypothetical protein